MISSKGANNDHVKSYLQTHCEVLSTPELQNLFEES